MGILASATLGYLGFGIQVPAPELGNLLSDGRAYLGRAHWLFWGPAVFVTLLPVPWLLVADAATERARVYGRLPWSEFVA